MNAVCTILLCESNVSRMCLVHVACVLCAVDSENFVTPSSTPPNEREFASPEGLSGGAPAEQGSTGRGPAGHDPMGGIEYSPAAPALTDVALHDCFYET